MRREISGVFFFLFKSNFHEGLLFFPPRRAFWALPQQDCVQPLLFPEEAEAEVLPLGSADFVILLLSVK